MNFFHHLSAARGVIHHPGVPEEARFYVCYANLLGRGGAEKRRKAAILRGRSAAKQCNAMLASPTVKSVGVGLLSGRKKRRKEKKNQEILRNIMRHCEWKRTDNSDSTNWFGIVSCGAVIGRRYVATGSSGCKRNRKNSSQNPAKASREGSRTALSAAAVWLFPFFKMKNADQPR